MLLRLAPCLVLLAMGAFAGSKYRQDKPLAVYAALFSRGEEWVKGKSPLEQPQVQEHMRHNGELGERYIGAAPFEKDFDDPNDAAVGLVLFLAESAAAAAEWAEADPMVQVKVMDVRVYRWRVDAVRAFVAKR